MGCAVEQMIIPITIREAPVNAIHRRPGESSSERADSSESEEVPKSKTSVSVCPSDLSIYTLRNASYNCVSSCYVGRMKSTCRKDREGFVSQSTGGHSDQRHS